MVRFDPDAATAAYMATLSPAAHAKATAYTQGGHWLLLWGWLVTVAAAWIILRSGVLVRIRGRVEARRPRPNLAVAGCVLAFLLIDWVIELPWSIYAAWWREGQYGLTKQPFGGWLGEDVLSLAISALPSVLLGLAIYALIRRAPRWWWAWSGGVVVIGLAALMILGPVLIEPLFNTYTPAPRGRPAMPSSRSPRSAACRRTRSTSITARNSPNATPPTSRACSVARASR